MPRESFVRLFAVKGVDAFAPSLYHVFKTAPKVEVSLLIAAVPLLDMGHL